DLLRRRRRPDGPARAAPGAPGRPSRTGAPGGPATDRGCGLVDVSGHDLDRLAGYLPDLAGGLFYSIVLTPVAMSIATALGVAFAIALNSRSVWLRRLVQWF